MKRDAILMTSYELAPNPCDHKTDIAETMTQQIR